MKKLNFSSTFLLLLLVACFTLPDSAVAAGAKKRGAKGIFGGGAFSVGLGLALSTADQTGMNTMIDAAKSAASSSASKMGTATEYVGYLTYRFANGYSAIQLRPTIFTQSSSGSGSDGSHDYTLDGYTVFPLARIIPLSNDFIDFYIQGGLGYGKLNGTVKTGASRSEFSGSAFGVQAGLGAEFCFVPEHCFNLEGNYRYMPIERNVVSSGTGTPHGTSQNTANKELEDLNGNDIATTLSGISGLISYTFNF
ncbi:MAG: hypothetical protein K0R29_1291 [Pseudobdellovibrio sp.]|jgi:hypothetical protein|nr:hypothetical protein [Pseudobdellovibrio sp.]